MNIDINIDLTNVGAKGLHVYVDKDGHATVQTGEDRDRERERLMSPSYTISEAMRQVGYHEVDYYDRRYRVPRVRALYWDGHDWRFDKSSSKPMELQSGDVVREHFIGKAGF